MQDPLIRVQVDFEQFIAGFSTMQLASVSAQGVPEASYAPFVRIEHTWYIYVSELALHTRNMIETAQAAVLLIEAEDAAKHIFARQRVSLQMQITEVSRETQDWQAVMAVFCTRFGEIMPVLRSLTDFHLMALTPVSGTFVRGFAQAFPLRVDGGLQVTQVTGRDVRA